MGSDISQRIANSIPTEGYKIIKIINPTLHPKLNLFSDYIISPTVAEIKAAKDQV
jgi:hypothetical protein